MPIPLNAPREGLPALIQTPSAFDLAIKALGQGSGPIAIDAERASGYRYSQRAYLIQIHRTGGGLHLIDPIAVGTTPQWQEMSDLFADVEWIIHASTQDLPCLRELGLEPKILFDTELGGRIAGCERVGLGPLSESLLDITLAKEHSAVDWSIRPLPVDWLNYAALDVDVLIDLRDEVEVLLEEQNKLEWALEDFASIISAAPPAPRKDPWRRTSGIHRIRDRQTLALIKMLWHARDDFARAIDLSPGRVFNDEALVNAAQKRPTTAAELKDLLSKRSRSLELPIGSWWENFREILAADPATYPESRIPATGLPPVKVWREKNPLGFARLSHARAGVIALSHELSIPPENLISPEFVRRCCWEEPDLHLSDTQQLSRISDQLRGLGARTWQIERVAPIIASALSQSEPLEAPAPLETSENGDLEE